MLLSVVYLCSLPGSIVDVGGVLLLDFLVEGRPIVLATVSGSRKTVAFYCWKLVNLFFVVGRFGKTNLKACEKLSMSIDYRLIHSDWPEQCKLQRVLMNGVLDKLTIHKSRVRNLKVEKGM